MPEDSPEVRGAVTVENVAGHSQTGTRSLALRYAGLAPGRPARVATPTFIPSRQVSDYFAKRGYSLYASPTLYAGQTLRAGLAADAGNGAPVCANLYVNIYGPDDELLPLRGPQVELPPNGEQVLTWQVPDTGGRPIAAVGVELSRAASANGQANQPSSGVAYLDYLMWDGTPDTVFVRPAGEGVMWRRAWVDGVDQYEGRWWEAFRMVQNSGRGLLIQGAGDWTDYQVSSSITLHMAEAAGLAARVQGMRRYYALLLRRDAGQGGKAQLIKALDGDKVLAETEFAWDFGETHEFALAVEGNRIRAAIDGNTIFTVSDQDSPLTGGGVAFVVEEGRVMSDAVKVGPLG
jgi:hypothetical protein